jgi:hypothetical protein
MQINKEIDEKNRTYGCGKAGDSGIMIRKKMERGGFGYG